MQALTIATQRITLDLCQPKSDRSVWKTSAIAFYQVTPKRITMNQVYTREQLLTCSENDVTFNDIDGFYNFEVQANGETVAELSHDAFNSSNPWYVSVSGVEVYRSTLYCEATDWVKLQYVAGALLKHQPQPVQVLTTREERAAAIEILEQHGDEFVVHNCENDHYYVVRPNHLEPNERCECADCHYRGVKCKHQIAVENFLGQRLEQVILTVAVSLEELLDKPFDELTREEWERLRKYSAPIESMELIAA
ncbi:MAG: hypothetical protein V7L26_15000 [Nostoc sp.]|uniref:hypothetical protein n=1 Tax=Nostoc sp. TaxID=1180 RepID=UPI002FF3E304